MLQYAFASTKRNAATQKHMPCPFHAILGLASAAGPLAPSQRASHIDLTPAITRAVAFARRQLPVLNEKVLNRSLNPDRFIENAIPVLLPFSEALFGSSSRWIRLFQQPARIIGIPCEEQAREALRVLGFIIDSAERHAQARGDAPGAALLAMRQTATVMTILGYIAGTVPRSTAYTVWTGNPQESAIRFTNDPGEAAFHEAVVTIDALHGKTAAALRFVALLDERPDSEAGIEVLTRANDFQRDVLAAYKKLAAKDESGGHVLTPRFFTTVFRTFLPTYPIDGTIFSGPNAAFLLNQRSVDTLTGVIDNRFKDFIVEHEILYMPIEDRQRLTADLQCPSVPAQLCAVVLHLCFNKILEVPDAELASRMAEASPSQREAFRQFFSLWNTAGRIRSVHRGFVRHWLEDEEKRLTDDEKKGLPVQANAGTGGATMADLDGIVEMVRNNPRVAKLWYAFKSTEGDDASISSSQGGPDHPALQAVAVDS